MMTSLFLLATSLSLLAIFRHDHRVCVHRITTSDYPLCIFILFLHILHIPHQKKNGNRDNKQLSPLKEDKGFFFITALDKVIPIYLTGYLVSVCHSGIIKFYRNQYQHLRLVP